MIDYQDIIKQLRSCVFTVMWPELACNAATAIQLLMEELDHTTAERDAAIHALSLYNDCKTCNQNCGGCDFELEPAPPCDSWKWKGIR